MSAFTILHYNKNRLIDYIESENKNRLIDYIESENKN